MFLNSSSFISVDFIAFSNRKTLNKNGVIYYDSTEFKNNMLRNDYVAKIIKREIEKETIEYVSIEDYAMSAKGMLFHIGEFVGNIKHTIYTEPNIKLRLYDPNTIKMFATGKGNGTKLDMYNSYMKLEEKKIDLTGFPIPKDKKGVLLTLEEAKPYMNGWSLFSGFGSPETYAINVWTNKRVLWITQYDGSTSLDSVSRFPVACMPYMPGG
jgi:Holliday junction resolvasome RuvABC endonuclease subunit